MGHDLFERDVGFAARGELRQEFGDFVHEGQLAFLDQGPYRGGGQHLGLAEQQEQRFVGGGLLAALGLRVAIGAEQREFAVPGKRDLRAGIMAGVDVGADQGVEVIQRLAGEAKTFEIAGRQRVGLWHGLKLPRVMVAGGYAWRGETPTEGAQVSGPRSPDCRVAVG